MRFRPLGVRVVATVCGVLLLVTLVGVWFALPAEVQHQFTAPQWVTCVAMVLGALAIGHALARCRVDADDGAHAWSTATAPTGWTGARWSR